MQQYFVISFFVGTSGRFIAQLIWNSLYKDKQLQIITDFNSVHINNFKSSYNVEPISRFDDLIYRKFSFNENTGLFTTHKLPNIDDYKIVCARYPNTKFIVISFTEDDLPEIIGNNMYKNGFANKTDTSAYNYMLFYNKIKNAYQIIYEKKYPYLDQVPPPDVMKNIYKVIFLDLIQKPERPYYTFIDPEIPDFIKERVLVLPYKQIFKVDFLLNSLASFLEIDNIKEQKIFAEEYIKGQQELVQQLMPWV